jgi:Trypsin
MLPAMRASLRILLVALALAGDSQAVVDGVIDLNAASSPWAGVGSLSHAGGGTYSAVVIAPNAVLTAAHIVAGGKPEAWTFNLNLGGDLTARLPVASIRTHPGYQGVGSGRDGLAHDDLAVVRLAGKVPFGTPVYELARRAPLPGERLVFVGYGAGGSSAGGAATPPDPAVKRVGANAVEQVYQDPGGAGRVELYRFAYTPLPGGSPLEATLAGGDSGSPAFVREPEGWRLAGINTYVYSSAQGRRGGGGVAVAAYREWIRAVVTSE